MLLKILTTFHIIWEKEILQFRLRNFKPNIQRSSSILDKLNVALYLILYFPYSIPLKYMLHLENYIVFLPYFLKISLSKKKLDWRKGTVFTTSVLHLFFEQFGWIFFIVIFALPLLVSSKAVPDLHTEKPLSYEKRETTWYGSIQNLS